jgi:hypothetical protein
LQAVHLHKQVTIQKRPVRRSEQVNLPSTLSKED